MLNNVTRSIGARPFVSLRIWRQGIPPVLALMLACRSVPAQSGIDAGQARDYAAGRRREIEFTNSALAMLACATSQDQRSVIIDGASRDLAESAAAGAVGVRVAYYRNLVSRVDSVLLATTQLDARLRGLDSLRVQLAVLRADLTARRSASPTNNSSNPPSRSTKCIAKSPPDSHI